MSTKLNDAYVEIKPSDKVTIKRKINKKFSKTKKAGDTVKVISILFQDGVAPVLVKPKISLEFNHLLNRKSHIEKFSYLFMADPKDLGHSIGKSRAALTAY